VAYFSKLRLELMIGLALIALMLVPIVVNAFFKEAVNIKKFEMLTDYLGNIIPIFTQKTKIRFTLNELYDLTNGSMKETIAKALSYLDNTTDDSDMNRNALAIIEREFPNSRVKSVHNLLLSIETATSNSYKEVCQNMYDDIEGWIKRVYTFEKDLRNRRTKLLILCLATLVMNCVFVSLYISNDYFIGFTDSLVYQISSFLFILIILITIVSILTKLHGEWLINDIDVRDEEQLKKDYLLYQNGIPKLKPLEIVVLVSSSITTVVCLYFGNLLNGTLALFMVILMATFPTTKYKKAHRHLQKCLTIEFPVWLREISLTLNSLTVLNAIEFSVNQVSYPMRKELKKFLEEAKSNPVSIKPYSNFLIDYDLEDARSSMKVLYAVNNVGKDDIKNRISNLIYRNQEMLAKAETIRNNDSIAGIEALGYIPTIIFSIQMMVSMFTMFTYMMSAITGAINI